jgi:dihydroorotate dehydrogenase (NAD+) catalytic subunit
LDLTTRIGSVVLPNPVLTASGTAGHGAELGAYVDLSSLGAVVVKSLKAEPWPGNAAPRVHEVTAGMINSVGLQGPGVEAWLRDELPPLLDAGARVVASIWGTSVDEYRLAADLLAAAPPDVVAVEVNLSCPNTHAGRAMFAHDEAATEEVLVATAGAGRPRWAKLTPHVTDVRPIADAARRGGAEAVVVGNTLLGMAVDPATRRYRLGSGASGGGVSGAAIHPVAVRAVHDVHAAFPDLPIVGVGGVVDGGSAAELLLVGASAVEVGTATFADPRAPVQVLQGLEKWLREQGERRVSDVIGSVRT